MSGARKLQTEIDRVMKKVDEGAELFDEIWEKVYSAEQQNQKEKYEMDLKKEIKKLQRLRDQIKTWIGSSEVKDKDPLIDARRRIETKMEQFKVCEKETKTKTYSKEGLARAEKLDPAEEAKQKTTTWIREIVENLQQMVDDRELEIERLSTGKGKKTNKNIIEENNIFISQHKFHINKLEGVMRLVNNDVLDVGMVDEMKEDLDYYMEAHEEDEYIQMYDEEIFYDALGLDDLAVVNVDRVTHSVPSGRTKSSASSVNDDHDSTSKSSHKERKASKKASSSGMIPLTIGRARVTSSGVADGKEPKSIITPKKIRPDTHTHHPPAPTNHALGPTPAKVPPPPQGASMAAILKRESEQQEKERQQKALQAQQQLLREQQARAQAELRQREVMRQQEVLREQQQQLQLAAAAQQDLKRRQQEQEQQLQQKQQQQQLIQQSQTQKQNLNVGVGNNLNVGVGNNLNVGVGNNLNVGVGNNLNVGVGNLNVGVGNNLNVGVGNNLNVGVGNLNVGVGNLNVGGVNVNNMSTSMNANTGPLDSLLTSGLGNLVGSTDTNSNSTSPIVAVSPAQNQNTSNHHPNYDATASYLGALNESFLHCPSTADSERPRSYTPRNPYPTPPSYPSTPSPIFDHAAIFEKLGPDCLFFIFYYAQGTYQQYLAARELKKQSWRYHKKYMTWFQRHEEPKVTTDEYEQGTYVYFDYETGWCQRIKSDFRFEYSYLEDSLII